jgi:hypothetical protein
MRAEMKHFIMRMGLAERDIVSLHVADASQNVEIDRIKERLARIERRLELTETRAGGGVEWVASRMIQLRDSVRPRKAPAPCPWMPRRSSG